MICSRQIFSDGGNEISEYTKNLNRLIDEAAAMRELFGGERVYDSSYKSAPLSKSELLDCSRRRARRKIFDYCICNDFDIFVTLTLDKSLIDRLEYEIETAIVFNDDTLTVKGNVYYAPIYMAMFLAPPPLPDKMIYEV